MAAHPTRIQVNTERGQAGLFFATSPDLPGFLLAERSMEDVELRAPGVIHDLLECMGTVVHLTREPGDGMAWEAVAAQGPARTVDPRGALAT